MIVLSSDKQNAFDRDWQAKCINSNGWLKNVSSDGLLGYKLMIQTGELDEPIDKQRVCLHRLLLTVHSVWIYSFAFIYAHRITYME